MFIAHCSSWLAFCPYEKETATGSGVSASMQVESSPPDNTTRFINLDKFIKDIIF